MIIVEAGAVRASKYTAFKKISPFDKDQTGASGLTVNCSKTSLNFYL